jgi:DNA-binding NarL/FixJ family response regulator
MSVTIVLAGDHTIRRHGLRLLLEEQEDFRVIAEASRGLEAIQLIHALQPNILIVDFMMPDLSGLEVTRRVRRHVPATCVVILSMYADEAHVIDVLRSGVRGYVLTRSSPASLVQAVREADGVGLYLSPPCRIVP